MHTSIPGKKVCELGHDDETYHIYACNKTRPEHVKVWNSDSSDYNIIWSTVDIARFQIRKGFLRDIIYAEDIDIDKVNDYTIDLVKLNFIEQYNLDKKEAREHVEKKNDLFAKLECN